MRRSSFMLFVALLLSGCLPTVNIATPDPVKIDVNMSVNIKSPPMPGTTTGSTPSLAERRRLRMGEVQNLKNARVIGENRDGYLEKVDKSATTAIAAYAESIIKAENEDRTQLYLDSAKQQSKFLEIIQHEYAHQWAERAYPGEYVQGDDGKWSQK